jgi:hypothetical protein
VDRAQWHPVRAELGAEHQQTAAAKALGDREGLLCTAEQGFGAVFIEKVAGCVPCPTIDENSAPVPTSASMS